MTDKNLKAVMALLFVGVLMGALVLLLLLARVLSKALAPGAAAQ